MLQLRRPPAPLRELGLGLFNFHYPGAGPPNWSHPERWQVRAVKSNGLWCQIPALPRLSCMTLRKCLCSSETSVYSSVKRRQSYLRHQIVLRIKSISDRMDRECGKRSEMSTIIVVGENICQVPTTGHALGISFMYKPRQC